MARVNLHQTILTAILLSVCSCGTFMGTHNKGWAVYRGVRHDASKISKLGFSCGREWGCLPLLGSTLYTIDVPLSFVADTATLPITIPVSLLRPDLAGQFDLVDSDQALVYQNIIFQEQDGEYTGKDKSNHRELTLRKMASKYQGVFYYEKKRQKI